MTKEYVPIESNIKPGYYVIPGYPDLLIALDDTVYVISKKEVVIPNVGYAGYYVACSRFIHRLKCIAFHGPAPLGRKIVNHKDGRKLNNAPDNLEWCDYKENAIHAYETGLRDDNIIIKVKHIDTGTVTRHYSMQDCARYLHDNAGSINKFIYRDNRNIKVYRQHYLIVLEHEEFPIITHNDRLMPLPGNPRPVLVVSFKEGDDPTPMIFVSGATAAKALGVNPGTITAMMSRMGIDDTLIWGDYKFVWLKDVDKVHELINERNRRTQQQRHKVIRKPIPVSVKFLETGEVKEYPSSEVLADELGVKKNTLQKGVFVGDGTWRGMEITYLK